MSEVGSEVIAPVVVPAAEVAEHKALSFAIVESKMVIAVDPNKNGAPVVKIEIDLKEVPAEVLAIIKG